MSTVSPIVRRQRGFTIVELLIVIVVIGILAAITIVAYNGAQQRARNVSRFNEAHALARALAAYKALNGSYPDFPNGVTDACIGGGYTDMNSDGLADCSDANVAGARHPNATIDAQIASISQLSPGDRTPLKNYSDGVMRLGITYSSQTGGIGANNSNPSVAYWQDGTGSCGSDRLAWNGSGVVALCVVDLK